MVQYSELLRFGPYQLVRPLGDCRIAKRWLVLHTHKQTSHTIYLFPACHDRIEKRRFSESMQLLASLNHPHILGIEMRSFAPDGTPWAITPYLGNHAGLVTIRDVVKAKGDLLPAWEAQRAVLQLLEAASYAHSLGLCHGPIHADDVLVDTHGSIFIEMYGVAQAMAGLGRSTPDLIADEVRALVKIAYRIATGLPADEPRIPASRINKRIPAAFDRWLEQGLNPSLGFKNADEAIAKLPCNNNESVDTSRVKTVLDKMRMKVWAK